MPEYTEYAQKLTQRDSSGNPVVSGWSLRLSGGGQGIAEKFWINLHQYGGTLLKQTGDGKWIAAYNSPEGRATLKQYVENVVARKTVTPQMKADAEAFELEQTAMFIRESWVIGDIKQKAPNLKYATAPLPRGSIALVTNLYVTADSDKGKMAWEFAKATTEPANLVWLLDNVGWLPNRKDVDYSSVTSRTPAFNAFLQYPPGYTFFTLPAIAPIEEILTRLAARLTRGFTDPALAKDDAAIDAFLSETAKETNTILRRADLLGSN
jgi:multiple sugar transport system substrate-binding protein